MGEDKVYRSTLTDIVGVLDWEMQKCETGEVLDYGNSVIKLNDIIIRWHLQRPTSWLIKLLKYICFLPRDGFYVKEVRLGE